MTDTPRPAFPTERPTGCPFAPATGYTELRERVAPSKVSTPVGVDAWVISRYDDVKTVLRDGRLSSRLAPSDHVVVDADLERVAETGSILQVDGPAHRRLRRLLATEFAVKRMEAMRPRIAKLVDEHIDAMLAAGGPVDLVEMFALPIPSLVICELLGVPYADRAVFQERGAVLVAIDTDPAVMEKVSGELTEYIAGLVMAKQAKREDDLLSRVITRGEELRENVTIEELVSIGFTLLIAGHETTANMIALSTLALLREPGQLAALRDRPELAASAVEELLRYLSVVQFGLFRHVLDDLEAGPASIEAGDYLIAALSAANRDESVFENPDELDLERTGAAHIAFGFGPHQCIGQQLARVELQEVFSRLYTRIPTLRLAVPFEEIRFKNNSLVYGVTALPVTWE
ncbi:cytochrome P450 [Kribbella sandramycini]|uniref:Cytochrome P450 n=1 Tax=Kribbella sandramycini TaxID=60450 RepID=A0A7Y4L3S6_9ACTN|nr:cytochrome P450 [Kribbella sandramycini]MBB6570651.1 cytochrome P450 [Kribbella sandramycini]NOL43795.1 cytochrome P450 [Kribbella sandramycini]